MGKKDKREFADMFKALGDPTRLKIYLFLRGRCWPHAADNAEEKWLENGPTVSEVSAKVTGSKKVTSKVSQHLKELRLAGLVTIERRGKNMICGINQDAVHALVALLHSTEATETVTPELAAIAEPTPIVEAVEEVLTEAVEAVIAAEEPVTKPRKRALKAKTVDLPVVEIELVKPTRKSKSQTNRQESSPPAA